ncbi:unnamed protein product [Linum tenue]|uniref:Uncharacterized protein n=1 Tax=Linum tenue TaxID=586396 RepID=A0AAV0RRF3_9ROSI|nr:unnamed protein product [Linum tenue]
MIDQGSILCTSGFLNWLGENSRLSTCFKDGEFFYKLECLEDRGEAREALVQVDPKRMPKLENCLILAKEDKMFEVATL